MEASATILRPPFSTAFYPEDKSANGELSQDGGAAGSENEDKVEARLVEREKGTTKTESQRTDLTDRGEDSVRSTKGELRQEINSSKSCLAFGDQSRKLTVGEVNRLTVYRGSCHRRGVSGELGGEEIRSEVHTGNDENIVEENKGEQNEGGACVRGGGSAEQAAAVAGPLAEDAVSASSGKDAGQPSERAPGGGEATEEAQGSLQRSASGSGSHSSSSKDSSKKRRSKSTASLKQRKLDARREQWLAQGGGGAGGGVAAAAAGAAGLGASGTAATTATATANATTGGAEASVEPAPVSLREPTKAGAEAGLGVGESTATEGVSGGKKPAKRGNCSSEAFTDSVDASSACAAKGSVSSAQPVASKKHSQALQRQLKASALENNDSPQPSSVTNKPVTKDTVTKDSFTKDTLTKDVVTKERPSNGRYSVGSSSNGGRKGSEDGHQGNAPPLASPKETKRGVSPRHSTNGYVHQSGGAENGHGNGHAGHAGGHDNMFKVSEEQERNGGGHSRGSGSNNGSKNGSTNGSTGRETETLQSLDRGTREGKGKAELRGGERRNGKVGHDESCHGSGANDRCDAGQVHYAEGKTSPSLSNGPLTSSQSLGKAPSSGGLGRTMSGDLQGRLRGRNGSEEGHRSCSRTSSSSWGGSGSEREDEVGGGGEEEGEEDWEAAADALSSREEPSESEAQQRGGWEGGREASREADGRGCGRRTYGMEGNGAHRLGAGGVGVGRIDNGARGVGLGEWGGIGGEGVRDGRDHSQQRFHNDSTSGGPLSSPSSTSTSLDPHTSFPTSSSTPSSASARDRNAPSAAALGVGAVQASPSVSGQGVSPGGAVAFPAISSGATLSLFPGGSAGAGVRGLGGVAGNAASAFPRRGSTGGLFGHPAHLGSFPGPGSSVTRQRPQELSLPRDLSFSRARSSSGQTSPFDGGSNGGAFRPEYKFPSRTGVGVNGAGSGGVGLGVASVGGLRSSRSTNGRTWRPDDVARPPTLPPPAVVSNARYETDGGVGAGLHDQLRLGGGLSGGQPGGLSGSLAGGSVGEGWTLTAEGTSAGTSSISSNPWQHRYQQQQQLQQEHEQRGGIDGEWGGTGVMAASSSGVPSCCPICTEELDVTDTSFVPCPCGFRLCLFCHHRILSEDGRCPGCRKAYASTGEGSTKSSRTANPCLRV
eukprot:TRINITY_DN13577_c0_g1_i1.p1 TRINITY_DN13577_c0_g1~~TRINITY_DN13577_c0_g1_i1.p1  ORF type:complete len:1165 (+),score=206.53 TRINITY_DN13577_c0_g1_i1:525-4019(+)